jgi:hypothetical protein
LKIVILKLFLKDSDLWHKIAKTFSNISALTMILEVSMSYGSFSSGALTGIDALVY